MFGKSFYNAQNSYPLLGMFTMMTMSNRFIDGFPYVEIEPRLVEQLSNVNVAMWVYEGKNYLPLELFNKMYHMAMREDDRVEYEAIWSESMHDQTFHIRVNETGCDVISADGDEIAFFTTATEALKYIHYDMCVVAQEFDGEYSLYNWSGQNHDYDMTFESVEEADKYCQDNFLMFVNDFQFLNVWNG